MKSCAALNVSGVYFFRLNTLQMCKYFASCLASSVFHKKNKTLRGNNLEEESS